MQLCKSLFYKLRRKLAAAESQNLSRDAREVSQFLDERHTEIHQDLEPDLDTAC